MAIAVGRDVSVVVLHLLICEVLWRVLALLRLHLGTLILLLILSDEEPSVLLLLGRLRL